MNKIPRLSKKEFLILDLLVREGELYGLEMVKARKELKRGTVYVTLNRMREKGYVESRLVEAPDPGPPRRMYSATGHGARVLRFTEQMRELASAEWGLT